MQFRVLFNGTGFAYEETDRDASQRGFYGPFYLFCDPF
jgi:hypothetical protein